MQKFQFSLERALAWRKLQAEGEQAKLDALLAKQQQLAAKQALLARQADRCRLECLASASLCGESLRNLAAFETGVRHKQTKLEQDERKCQSAIIQQRQRTIEAERQRRLLEKLRETRFAEWRSQMTRELDAAASEFFLASWVRKERG
jgi:flagellar FliJ protein